MPQHKHNDEALEGAVESLKALLKEDGAIVRASLVDDLFGKLRVVVEIDRGTSRDATIEQVRAALIDGAGDYFSGDVWVLNEHTPESDRSVYEQALDCGDEVGNRLRVHSRHRNRVAWSTIGDPKLWSLEGEDVGPPVIAFCSFKGGVGRTTTLAAFAIQRARLGEHVVVVDLDLDAPGLGILLAADREGTVNRWGVVDFLIEHAISRGPLSDYFHLCSRETVTEDGRPITVFPAGRLDAKYQRKLTKVDLEPNQRVGLHPFEALLHEIREELEPDWLLVDARAGLSPAAGLLFAGLAHLYVLFGTASEQTYPGLALLIHQLGAARFQRGYDQGDCLIVQSMVPDNRVVADEIEQRFRDVVQDIFEEHYLVAEEENAEDRYWSLRDIDTADAPQVPIPVHYREAFAHFSTIDDVADELIVSSDHVSLGERILGRCAGNEIGE